jgi:uncharacterized protein YndB with AHSA1/START domain
MENRPVVAISATIKAPVEKVWKLWTNIEDITSWNSPSPDWHTPRAENDVKDNGNFLFRMEAKDGSFGFDFAGVYTKVIPNEVMEYTMGDGRKVKINFISKGDETHIDQTFEAESENPVEMQQNGWQAILNNFKAYAEK